MINVVDTGKELDANQLSMFVTNIGSFAYDLQAQNSGLEFPKGTGKTCVYAAGIWMGAKVAGQTRVTVAEYSQEFTPGTMTGWPELGAAEQRRRLVALLSDLAARTCNRVEVVFDGAEVDGGAVTVPAAARRWVRVRFSPPDVEADDVVLDLVAQLPAGRPVIVVSSDNRVREGARRGGANLLYSRQLLDTLGVGTG